MGGNIGNYLEANHWAVGMDYRYLHADEMFKGDQYQPQFNQGGTNADITIHSWDVFVTYAPLTRLDLTLNIPFSYGTVDVVSNRLHQTAVGLGDIRFTADAWVLPPDNHPNGNVSLGVGFKAPTGDSNYKNDGQTYIVSPGQTAVGTRPVDSAIQPGDGAWAVIGELSAFQKIFPETYLYLAGSYQFSTVGEGDTETTTDPNVHYSAPDTYMGRAGATYFFWPSQGLSLSLGARVEGIPVNNVITGSDMGFRRPGYAVYIEPSIAWNFKDNTFTLNGPFAVYRVRENSTRDDAGGTQGVGGLANFLIIFSYTHWF